jgi:hypothetical protein
MPRLCIVESREHPAPGVLGRLLPGLKAFGVERAVPEDFGSVDVLILNSVPPTPDSILEDRVLQFVEGGGLFSIHDTASPYSPRGQAHPRLALA